MMDLEQVDPHLMQQYEPGEDEFVTKYIYLENFSTEIIRLEQIYQLKLPFTYTNQIMASSKGQGDF